MFEPVPLNLPSFPFRIKEESGNYFIFDEIRKKYLLLTPEEWVRQHVVQYLISEKKYPRSLIKLEGGLRLNTLQKRTDILFYNSAGEKILLVECKAPQISITQETFDQVARYNLVHKVKWLMVSNGLQHFCCRIDLNEASYKFVNELPAYSES
ncbi:type I restriction enzyme HsdR N-terminal domain-containing protein [Daejeonella oryzae]|uniref:type I restriction enzyme HsdR N-terminal domain-containing protein n=1 Tax=Daejeonella oryzae TaxID=1122943 RepID=UPI0003F4B49E|nr:type I restriction enzyme HsdR N-terminal domain-containing protein [Daejeonella oryzae]